LAFSPDAAPTRANITKRIRAAQEALGSAVTLASRAGEDRSIVAALESANEWALVAGQRLDLAKGKRR
jgi:hypothetical protein